MDVMGLLGRGHVRLVRVAGLVAGGLGLVVAFAAPALGGPQISVTKFRAAGPPSACAIRTRRARPSARSSQPGAMLLRRRAGCSASCAATPPTISSSPRNPAWTA